jgi:hypothetical protein
MVSEKFLWFLSKSSTGSLSCPRLLCYSDTRDYAEVEADLKNLKNLGISKHPTNKRLAAC